MLVRRAQDDGFEWRWRSGFDSSILPSWGAPFAAQGKAVLRPYKVFARGSVVDWIFGFCILRIERFAFICAAQTGFAAD